MKKPKKLNKSQKKNYIIEVQNNKNYLSKRGKRQAYGNNGGKYIKEKIVTTKNVKRHQINHFSQGKWVSRSVQRHGLQVTSICSGSRVHVPHL